MKNNECISISYYAYNNGCISGHQKQSNNRMCSIQLLMIPLLRMTGNASIIVCIVENWNAFIILHVILYFLHFTTNATPSVRPSQTYNPCISVNTPLPYILITNTAKQFLGGNLLRNSFDILQTCNIEWFINKYKWIICLRRPYRWSRVCGEM